MRAEAQVDIKAPKERVWATITDIENSIGTISAIERIEVLERPKGSLVGFKWRETRTMFGKQATEVMWVTEEVPGSHYVARAESHGSIYTSRLAVTETPGGTRLTMAFHGKPVSLGARIMWGGLGFLFKGATRKALQKDLDDIKAALEGAGKPHAATPEPS